MVDCIQKLIVFFRQKQKQSNKYKNIGNALKEELTYANALDFVLIQIGKAIMDVDKQTGDLAKGFNITYNDLFAGGVFFNLSSTTSLEKTFFVELINSLFLVKR